MENKNIKEVAIADKALLTLEEAAKYFNIGINKLRIMTNEENCPYVVWNGSKRLIKRKPFEEYLYSSYSI
jgi:excisionase family DNA binding protein